MSDLSKAPSATEATVEALFVKKARGAPMLNSSARGIQLVRRYGIVGDCQASVLGPRQVLLIASEDLEDLGLSHAALRANIVTRGIPLNSLSSGTLVHLGATAQIRLTHRCEVCAHIGQLAGVSKLKVLSGRRGFLGTITRAGHVNEGDTLRLGTKRYGNVPDHVFTRLLWVIRQIPSGRVLPYDLLVHLVGAPRGYLRALPRAVRAARERALPAHRVVTSHGNLLHYLEDQQRLLSAEGLRCQSGSLVDLASVAWRPTDLYFRSADVTP